MKRPNEDNSHKTFKELYVDFRDKRRFNWVTWHLIPWFGFTDYGVGWVLEAGFCTIYSIRKATDFGKRRKK